jgi:hypothetical protein
MVQIQLNNTISGDSQQFFRALQDVEAKLGDVEDHITSLEGDSFSVDVTQNNGELIFKVQDK